MRPTELTDRDGGAVSEGDIVELVLSHQVHGMYKQQARVILSDGEWWFQLLETENGRIERIEAARRLHLIYKVIRKEGAKG